VCWYLRLRLTQPRKQHQRRHSPSYFWPSFLFATDFSCEPWYPWLICESPFVAFPHKIIYFGFCSICFLVISSQLSAHADRSHTKEFQPLSRLQSKALSSLMNFQLLFAWAPTAGSVSSRAQSPQGSHTALKFLHHSLLMNPCMLSIDLAFSWRSCRCLLLCHEPSSIGRTLPPRWFCYLLNSSNSYPLVFDIIYRNV
jgi:hypothetical protein